MIDIHSHVLFGVDDGPSTLEESVRMVAAAEKLGIEAIIATPHYHRNIFENERVAEHFEKLKYETRDYGVNILLGYEVFADNVIKEMCSKGQFLTLSQSGYMLLELPFHVPLQQLQKVLSLFRRASVRPVLAHPERNRYFQLEANEFIDTILKSECLTQLDAGSIAGVYGKRVRDLCKQLCKQGLAGFVASNAHYGSDYTSWYERAYDQVLAWCGEEYTHLVFHANAQALLDGRKNITYRVIQAV